MVQCYLEKIHIYTEKNEPLKLMKEYKNARLKSFKSLSEAKEFIKTGFENSKSSNVNNLTPSSMVTVEEKSSNFKSLKPQELVGLRKLIESGDLEAVNNIIHENPRYLVSSGDTPAVLQVSIDLIKFIHNWNLRVVYYRKDVVTMRYM